MSAVQSLPNAPVLLYDGVCGVCNSAVRTLLRFDRHGTLRFSSLDSDFARDIRSRHHQLEGVDSAVCVRNAGQPDETVDIRSAALLQVAAYLAGWWKLALAAYVIPPAVRDWPYERFAAFRYRIGGQHHTCPIPTAEARTRFFDATYQLEALIGTSTVLSDHRGKLG
ncbi:thiol-disulfide oxidoreductase [Mycobacterium lentiflavum]|uniref:Thiol-disulfide oxidoreductase n=1 Tax=Mycobacterium lentiflavum TaxID=141349 RepID=A0A0E4H346_MYCLN|nr:MULTISPECIES: DCC1-like thiol-disulfide oxidoreductase family protein [Mycobacterium simiae complex]MEE3064991.1 DCC1-like thiol-disulfide oxidoreductase family protein [Actinomycetota bacterium]ULP45520.1 DCC1-like thiol-disulfide oxidoreductase family protein [Mycobacterium lentiflavum]CQD24772.1 thiol-disulfide oxidoreductase [Mycobacterium lentiflavum]